MSLMILDEECALLQDVLIQRNLTSLKQSSEPNGEINYQNLKQSAKASFVLTFPYKYEQILSIYLYITVTLMLQSEIRSNIHNVFLWTLRVY